MTKLSTAVKFDSLEGLRGILALCVCVSHLGLYGALSARNIYFNFGLSVDIFFALSGFVLCHTNYFGKKPFRRFVVGRIARLWPLHILTLAAMVIIYIVNGRPLRLDAIVEHVFLINNVGIKPTAYGLNFPSWSVSIEIWISLMFFLLVRKQSLLLLAVTSLIFFPLYLVFPGYPNTIDSDFYGFICGGLIRGVVGFCIGCAAYLIFTSFGARITKSPIPSYCVLSVFLAIFFVPIDRMWVYLIFYGSVGSFLVLSAAADKKSFLASRFLVFFGTISYSVYLLHIPVDAYLFLAFGTLSRGVGKIFVFVLILVISYGSYRFVEMPIQRWFIRLFSPSLAPRRSAPKISA